MKLEQIRKWAYVVLVLALIVVLAGCSHSSTGSSAQKKAPKDMKIGVLMPSLDGYIYVANLYGVFDEAKKLGVPQPTVLTAGGYNAIDIQTKQIDDLVASGVDAIIFFPLSLDAETPAIDRAIGEGVKVVEMGNETNSTKVQSRVSFDMGQIGGFLGKEIGDALNGHGNIVAFDGPAGASWSIGMTKGYKDMLSQSYPGIKILGERWTVYDAGDAFNNMNDFMQAFNNIDGVYTCSSLYAEGAASAIAAAGKTGKIKVVTQGVDPNTIKLLKDGSFTTLLGTGDISRGRISLSNAVKLIDGEPVEKEIMQKPTAYTKADLDNPNVDLSDEIYPQGWTVPK